MYFTLIIFEGPDACDAEPLQGGWGEPVLYMESARPTADRYATSVSVPVYFRSRGWAINSLVFSVDYDEKTLAFDPSDKDRDGIPDAVRFKLPASVQVTVSFDRADADGELDISIFDPNQVLDRGSRSPLLTIGFQPATGSGGAARVGFSHDPAASFGDLFGRSVPGRTRDRPGK